MTALVVALLIPWAAGVVLTVLDGRRGAVRWAAVAALGASLVLVLGPRIRLLILHAPGLPATAAAKTV